MDNTTTHKALDAIINLRGFYNDYCTLLSDDQRSYFSYDEARKSIVMMRGVLVLEARHEATGAHASLLCMQVKEPKIYKYAAHLLDALTDWVLPGFNADWNVQPGFTVKLEAAGYQCVLGVERFSHEVQYAHGTVERFDKEHEVRRIHSVVMRRKK